MQIRKAAKSSKIQEVLGLDDISYENFKTYARDVHLELCKNPQLDWGNTSIEWGALPVDEKKSAISEIRSRSGKIFGTKDEKAIEHEKAIEQGIIARLHYHRKQRQREQQVMHSGLETTQSGPATPQKAPEAPKSRPFDPAVILNDENDP